MRLPNGSRLSCGRNARGRKAAEPQTKRLAGEATQFFPQEAPGSFKRMLGGGPSNARRVHHVPEGNRSQCTDPPHLFCNLQLALDVPQIARNVRGGRASLDHLLDGRDVPAKGRTVSDRVFLEVDSENTVEFGLRRLPPVDPVADVASRHARSPTMKSSPPNENWTELYKSYSAASFAV